MTYTEILYWLEENAATIEIKNTVSPKDVMEWARRVKRTGEI